MNSSRYDLFRSQTPSTRLVERICRSGDLFDPPEPVFGHKAVERACYRVRIVDEHIHNGAAPRSYLMVNVNSRIHYSVTHCIAKENVVLITLVLLTLDVRIELLECYADLNEGNHGKDAASTRF